MEGHGSMEEDSMTTTEERRRELVAEYDKIIEADGENPDATTEADLARVMEIRAELAILAREVGE